MDSLSTCFALCVQHALLSMMSRDQRTSTLAGSLLLLEAFSVQPVLTVSAAVSVSFTSVARHMSGLSLDQASANPWPRTDLRKRLSILCKSLPAGAASTVGADTHFFTSLTAILAFAEEQN